MNRRFQIFFLVLALGNSLAISIYGMDPQGKRASGASPKTAVAPPIRDPTYIIGPQDMLAVNVWKEPDLSGNVQVRPDGKVSIPLLDDVQAAGLTAMGLSSEITTGLKRYVADPRVTVVVTAINSRRIYVLGEVARAGSFTLLPDMTVLQAISVAGGLTQFAHGKKIYVLRNEGGKQTKHPFNYNRVLKGKRSEDNFTLNPGDTIVVP